MKFLLNFSHKETGQQLHELRRGLDKALIYCLAFDRACNYIACTSDKVKNIFYFYFYKNITSHNFIFYILGDMSHIFIR